MSWTLVWGDVYSHKVQQPSEIESDTSGDGSPIRSWHCSYTYVTSYHPSSSYYVRVGLKARGPRAQIPSRRRKSAGRPE
jgi:hypothetical protein